MVYNNSNFCFSDLQVPKGWGPLNTCRICNYTEIQGFLLLPKPCSMMIALRSIAELDKAIWCKIFTRQFIVDAPQNACGSSSGEGQWWSYYSVGGAKGPRHSYAGAGEGQQQGGPPPPPCHHMALTWTLLWQGGGAHGGKETVEGADPLFLCP